jgi:alkylated DNA repair dioxygenase AlkB
MAQLGLFESGQHVLVDDATGRIVYVPDCVDGDTAAAWFRSLRDTTPWRSERRQMYDREVDVPRLCGAYRLHDADVPEEIVQAARIVCDRAAAPFTSVGLNFYRDGRDSVAPHNDHRDEIVAGHPIALLSLGSTRRMTIRSKARPRRILDLDLEPGSLLVMSYETQVNYDHGIPKSTEPVGPRISLAFRVRAR